MQISICIRTVRKLSSLFCTCGDYLHLVALSRTIQKRVITLSSSHSLEMQQVQHEYCPHQGKNLSSGQLLTNFKLTNTHTILMNLPNIIVLKCFSPFFLVICEHTSIFFVYSCFSFPNLYIKIFM